MKVKCKQWEQRVPGKLEEVWSFFSRPENLDRLTPPDMPFEIISDIKGQDMYPGMIVRYRVSPIWGIRMDWTTEITSIEEGRYFIDNQRSGPYELWHHQHHFIPDGDHTLMKDILHYKIGYGPLGTLIDTLFVDGRVEEIFSFRKKKVRELFGNEKD